MDFALDEQQRAFATSVRELAADRLAGAARAAYDDPDSGLPEKLWSTIAAQGWLAVTVPEELGGLGLGLVEAQLVGRGVGAATLPGPWRAAVIALEAIRLGAAEGAERELLEGLASGARIGTHAVDQQVMLSAAGATGRLVRVEYAEAADVLVVAAADGSLRLVELAGTGVRISAQQQHDRTARLSVVELTDAPVTPLPNATVADVLPRACVLTAAELVGVAREALTRTVAYDSHRIQFGKPVGSFQALKHALADLHVGVTMAEQAVLYAAHALDAVLPDAELAVAVAKAKASSVALDATAVMIQFHGGIGFTWEHEAHFYFKRARRLAPAFGDAAYHRERIAALFLDAG
jgi:alkylation response protein AidB-like acyl-CoA dehydrogenase